MCARACLSFFRNAEILMYLTVTYLTASVKIFALCINAAIQINLALP